MNKKYIAFLLVVLFALAVLVPSANAGESVFSPTYKVTGNVFDIDDVLNYNYNSIYTNSKGDVWLPTVDDKNKSKGDYSVWMYKLDMKNNSILKKVRIGETYFFMLYKPSPDGRYLYSPIVKTKFMYGFKAIDSWNLACFDAEEGKVIWSKYIKNDSPDFTDYLPVQDGLIELFTNTDYHTHETVYKTIVLKVSSKGDNLWEVTIPGHYGIVTTNGDNLLLSDGEKILSLDTKTGIYNEEGEVSGKAGTPEPIVNRGTPTFSKSPIYYVAKSGDDAGTWSLYRFSQSDGKNELVEIVPHLPVRNNPVSIVHGTLFVPAVYDGYFVFIDTLLDFHDQNVYVYDKDGKLLWHRDVMPSKPTYFTGVTPKFANGMFFYSARGILHAVDIKSGKDVYTINLGNFALSALLAAESNGTVWTDAFNAEDVKKSGVTLHLFKISETRASLTVNANVKDGSFDIIQGSAKETVKFGSKVELPVGNYTLHFHKLDGVNGVQAPEDLSISLKENENKVLSVEYRDVEPPVITVEPIEPPTVMGGVAYFTVKGSVKDNFSGVKSVSVNGANVSVGEDGSFSQTITVYSKGTITFVVSAEDNAGNKAAKTLTAVYNPPIVIRLKLNSKMFFVNETAEVLDSPPIIIPKWNRTVVPIRAIVEALGGTIGWDPVERMVTIKLGDNMINLWIDKPQAMVNGVMEWIDENNHDVRPVIINGRTMLPLRFVAESLGCTVDWDPVAKTITIKYTP